MRNYLIFVTSLQRIFLFNGKIKEEAISQKHLWNHKNVINI